jgi:hypothetical protein
MKATTDGSGVLLTETTSKAKLFSSIGRGIAMLRGYGGVDWVTSFINHRLAWL